MKIYASVFFLLFHLTSFAQLSPTLEHKSPSKYLIKCFGINSKNEMFKIWSNMPETNKFSHLDGVLTDNTVYSQAGAYVDYRQMCQKTLNDPNQEDPSKKGRFYRLKVARNKLAKLHHVIFPPKKEHSPIKRLVVFGDSFSDSGNLFKATAGLIPKNPYWEGRFSNGPVWSEYLAYSLNIKLDNWAYSGSPTSSQNLLQVN